MNNTIKAELGRKKKKGSSTCLAPWRVTHVSSGRRSWRGRIWRQITVITRRPGAELTILRNKIGHRRKPQVQVQVQVEVLAPVPRDLLIT